MDLAGIILSCTVALAPEVIAAIVLAESCGDPYLVAEGDRQWHSESRDEAVQPARRLIAQGRRLHLGIAQMSSDGLAHYGLTVETAFDPCASIGAAEVAVMEGFVAARRLKVDDMAAPEPAALALRPGHRWLFVRLIPGNSHHEVSRCTAPR